MITEYRGDDKCIYYVEDKRMVSKCTTVNFTVLIVNSFCLVTQSVEISFLSFLPAQFALVFDL